MHIEIHHTKIYYTISDRYLHFTPLGPNAPQVVKIVYFYFQDYKIPFALANFPSRIGNYSKILPKTIQLAMMVSRTVYSKGGHSMRNLVVLRMMFRSLRMKREVGPWPPVPWSVFIPLRPMRWPLLLAPSLAFSLARLACSAAASLKKN